MAILLAIGEDTADDRTVTVAHDLAEAFDEKLHALHVIPERNFREYKDSIESTPEFKDFSITKGEQSASYVAEHAIKQTLGAVEEDIELRGRVGDPAEEILAEADSIDARFIVLGGRRRSPVGKAVFGSVVQTVLLNAEHPVVTSLVE